MPNPVKAYSCEICGEIFTGPQAYEDAQIHEEELAAPEFRFAIGERREAKYGLMGGTKIIVITQRKIQYLRESDIHRCAYMFRLVGENQLSDGAWIDEWTLVRSSRPANLAGVYDSDFVRNYQPST